MNKNLLQKVEKEFGRADPGSGMKKKAYFYLGDATLDLRSKLPPHLPISLLDVHDISKFYLKRQMMG